jgi:hypothetical protein
VKRITHARGGWKSTCDIQSPEEYRHMPDPKPCLRQQELMSEVQRHLHRIAELARAETNAIKNQESNLWKELDQQIELEIGEKERSIGSLNEHRSQHGC